MSDSRQEQIEKAQLTAQKSLCKENEVSATSQCQCPYCVQKREGEKKLASENQSDESIAVLQQHPNGIYDDSSYKKHGSQSKSGLGKKGENSKAPEDGQAALDNSVETFNDGNKQRRIGVDKRNQEVVVLDGQNGVFHGHVPSKLNSKQQTCIKKNFPNVKLKKGKAVKFK